MGLALLLCVMSDSFNKHSARQGRKAGMMQTGRSNITIRGARVRVRVNYDLALYTVSRWQVKNRLGGQVPDGWTETQNGGAQKAAPFDAHFADV